MFFGLSWNGFNGQIRQGKLAASIFHKPEVGFAYDQLMYDPEAELFFKTIGQENVALSEAESELCKAYIAREIDQADYIVYTYNDNMCFHAAMDHKEAKEQSMPFVLEAPDHPSSRFNEDSGAWERIKACICSKGYLTLDPDVPISEPIGIFLTEAEWKKFPKPDFPNGPYKWDFAHERWTDARDLGEEKQNITHEMSYLASRQADIEFGRPVSAADISSWAVSKDKRDFMRYNLILSRYLNLRNVFLPKVENCDSLKALDLLRVEFRNELEELVCLDPSQDEKLAQWKISIQLRLDSFAQSREYDDAKSAMAYLGCKNEAFAAEAACVQNAVVDTWAFANRRINEALSGGKPMTSWQEFEKELDGQVPLAWPVAATETVAAI